ncbi:hypothetical protein HDA32_000802 [Spinactinospora alkalitolerans]|uniref:DUF742 domain-containing protein n=1 Tax=Spinactinospora alkalitolerans TaxID=687207 RepID=A0A852TS47_9ACTN|nr:DUF742 domain-containing protein [Spinactinospora alkalitolerans]NYE45682.1 hypothetical protein [Spinactinospora alkalitolerans]
MTNEETIELTAHPGRSDRIRSFSLTGGRTRSRSPLLLETLVSAIGVNTTGFTELTPEQRDIYLICEKAKSVTEIAASLKMPLGVVRILINDLADQGRVAIHATVRSDESSHRNLLERILHGLDAIAQ